MTELSKTDKQASREAARAERKAAKEASRAAKAQAKADRAAHILQSYGRVVRSGSFGTSSIEVYEKGYVRVASMWMSDKTPFERLLGISYSRTVQDKSLGGRAAGAMMTGGLNLLLSKEKRSMYLTITTDLKVHALVQQDGSLFSEKEGLALEAAGKSVLSTTTTSVAPEAHASVADQLKKLGDLHTSGLLTDNEFAAAKAKLLS